MKGELPGGQTLKGLEPWVVIWADFGFDQIDLETAKRARKKEGE